MVRMGNLESCSKKRKKSEENRYLHILLSKPEERRGQGGKLTGFLKKTLRKEKRSRKKKRTIRTQR